MVKASPKPSNPRQDFNRPFAALPELSFIGRDSLRKAGALGLHAHHHDVMEICYVEKGVVWWWAGKKSYEVRGGQAFVVQPGEEHGGSHGNLNPCKLYWLGLSPWHARYLGLPAAEARRLQQGLRGLKSHCFDAAPGMAAAFEQILDGIAKPGGSLQARVGLLDLLLRVQRDGHAAGVHKQSTMVGAAVGLMESHLADPLPLPDLAKKLGWSESHLKHQFAAELGLSPADYYLRRRVRQACFHLEKTAMPVTEVGLATGFSSSQYFATAFKRITGLTPQAFRAAFSKREH